MATSTLPALAQDAAADRAESTALQGGPPSPIRLRTGSVPPALQHEHTASNPQKRTCSGHSRLAIRPTNALILWCNSVWCSELARTRIMSRRNHAEFGARVHSLCAGVLRGPCPASFLAGGEGHRAYPHKNYRTREFFDRFYRHSNHREHCGALCDEC
jgi:hypothetical protein